MESDKYVGTGEAAKGLGVSNLTIINYIKAKKLKGKQNPINRRWKILKSSVEKLLDEKRGIKRIKVIVRDV